MKILLLTRNNPIEITNIVQRIYETICNRLEIMTVVSPQVVALMVEEAKGYPYLETYYSAVRTVEKEKENMTKQTKVLVVVGSVPRSSRIWYDAVVGLDDENASDYPIKTIPNNTDKVEMMNVKEADVIFNDFEQLRIFLTRIVNKEATDVKRESELQQEATRGN